MNVFVSVAELWRTITGEHTVRDAICIGEDNRCRSPECWADLKIFKNVLGGTLVHVDDRIENKRTAFVCEVEPGKIGQHSFQGGMGIELCISEPH